MIANRPHARHHVYLRNFPAHDDSPGAFPLPPKPGSAAMMTVCPSSRAAVCRPAAAGARRGAGNRVETKCGVVRHARSIGGQTVVEHTQSSASPDLIWYMITAIREHRWSLRERHASEPTANNEHAHRVLPTTVGGAHHADVGRVSFRWPRSARQAIGLCTLTHLPHTTRAHTKHTKHTRACAHTHLPTSALARARMHAQARSYRRLMRTPTYAHPRTPAGTTPTHLALHARQPDLRAR